MLAKRFLAALFPVFVIALTVIPSVFASTTYTKYNWATSCSGNGNGVVTASWSWYAGGTSGASLGSGVVTCTGTASLSGTCPSQGVCSVGRPSNANTIVVDVNISCGIATHKGVIQSVTPGTPVSVTVSDSVKRGNCNGTYDKGQESGTVTITA